VNTLYTLKIKLSKIVSNKSLFQVMARIEVADNVSLETIMELFQVSVREAGKLDLKKIAKSAKKGS